MKKFNIIGLGELLWDIFPHGRKLGGAPANFAYHVSSLGHNSIILSRVGSDDLGIEILNNLSDKKLNTTYVQVDKIYPTGTVEVIIDRNNQPDYKIHRQVAWDFIEWQDSFIELLDCADAICFGSLAQRNSISRKTILDFLKKTRKDTELVFDINLRQDYFNKNIIERSLELSTILKLNDSELKILKMLLGIDKVSTQEEVCSLLLQKYDLRLICLTKGKKGSILFNGNSIYKGNIFPCKVEDSVGAGDAFTAAMIIQFLNGSSLEDISYSANKLASWVTSKEGGMPAYDDNLLI